MVKINQLFRQPVPAALTERLVRAFGLFGLQDPISFTRHSMRQAGTVAALQGDLIPELRGYYLPCKARVFLQLADCPDRAAQERRCVTILRQVLRLHGYFLLVQQRSIMSRKITLYRIASPEEGPGIRVHQGAVRVIFCD